MRLAHDPPVRQPTTSSHDDGTRSNWGCSPIRGEQPQFPDTHMRHKAKWRSGQGGGHLPGGVAKTCSRKKETITHFFVSNIFKWFFFEENSA